MPTPKTKPTKRSATSHSKSAKTPAQSVIAKRRITKSQTTHANRSTVTSRRTKPTTARRVSSTPAASSPRKRAQATKQDEAKLDKLIASSPVTAVYDSSPINAEFRRHKAAQKYTSRDLIHIFIAGAFVATVLWVIVLR